MLMSVLADARCGLLGGDAVKSMEQDVLEFVKENDIKFIRLGFCDLFGFPKNISIMADGLTNAFEHGVSFDAYAINGFNDAARRANLFLFPDVTTLTMLPWRPGPGRVARFFCDIKYPDGAEFSRDCRGLLKRVVKRAKDLGYVCKIGVECEFYLFKTDENGEPTDIPFDKGSYLDMSPLDRGEDVRREICLTLEEMGIKPEGSHHGQGPGQNEIDFKFSDALVCADNLQAFKSVVKAVAARNGLFASFMPKPVPDAPGSGLSVNLSLSKDGVNIFKSADCGHSDIAESFIAGILAKTPEITLFLNPVTNSYERFGRLVLNPVFNSYERFSKFEAPKYISWAHGNHSQLINIPAASGEKVRMELRSPDPSPNPYLAFSLILAAGLDGIEDALPLPPAVDADLFAADESVTQDLKLLPDSLEKAVQLAENSDFVKNVTGDELLSRYLFIKKAEAADFAEAVNKTEFYKRRYFGVL